MVLQTKILAGLVGLSKLRYLNLSDTTRGGGFPEFIERVASLEVLALNYNKMNGIPPAAGNTKFYCLK